MDIREWAAKLMCEVKSKWEESKGDHSELQSGFSVFYSPIQLNPDLLIIGLNPGGSAADFDIDRSMQIPEQHDYFEHNYPLARKMKALFASIGQSESLKNSIKTNFLFFRTRSFKEWNALPIKVRGELERFCSAKVREIITELQPRMILAEGFMTYSLLREAFNEDTIPESKIAEDGVSVFRKSTLLGVPLVGILHPTGARISKRQWSRIEAELKNSMDTIRQTVLRA